MLPVQGMAGACLAAHRAGAELTVGGQGLGAIRSELRAFENQLSPFQGLPCPHSLFPEGPVVTWAQEPSSGTCSH